MICKHKLKKQRLLKGFTQESLAEVSNMSIRTIQRIEKGNSYGSPYTLQSLTRALGIDNAALLSDDYSLEELADDNRGVKLLNLSSISMLIIPFGNLLIPVILYLFGVSKGQGVKVIRDKIFSFQIIYSLITIVMMVVLSGVLIGFFDAFRGFKAPLFIPIYYLAAFINVFIIIRIAICLNNHQEILPRVPNFL